MDDRTITDSRTSDDDFAVYSDDGTFRGYTPDTQAENAARAAFDAHEAAQVPAPAESGVVPTEAHVRRLDREAWADTRRRIRAANEKARLEARIAEVKKERERRRIADELAAALPAGAWLGGVA